MNLVLRVAVLIPQYCPSILLHTMPGLLSPSFLTETAVSSEVLLQWQKFLLQEARITYNTFNWGSVVWQQLKANGFVFGYQIFHLTQAAQIRLFCDSDSGIIHFTLKGGATFKVPGEVPVVSIPEHYCCLGFHPAGSQVDVWLPAGEHHYFQLAFTSYFYRYLLQSFISQPAQAASIVGDILFFHPVVQIKKRMQAIIRRLFSLVPVPVSKILFWNETALQLIECLISDTNNAFKKKQWEKKKHLKIEELEPFIAGLLDHDSKKLVSDIICARKTGLSVYQFKKLFLQHYQLTLPAFIRKKQMEKALLLIQVQQLPIGEIYLQAGFGDFSSFSRAFTRYYGNPPSFYYPKTID